MTDLVKSIDDILFFDFETKSTDEDCDDLSRVGAYRYAQNCKPIILAYAIGDGPVKSATIATDGDGEGGMRLPEDFEEFFWRTERGEGYFAAWNTAFDREVFRCCFSHRGYMDIEMTIDVMAQAMASNLPGKLDEADKAIGGEGKQEDGGDLIELFCSSTSEADHNSHPEAWADFVSYAERDVEALRRVFKGTRQLPLEEWQEYWAAENINQRGVAIDLEFCEKANALSYAGVQWANQRLRELTGIPGMRVTAPQSIAAWVQSKLQDPAALTILEEEIEDDDDEEDSVAQDDQAAPAKRGTKLRLTRTHIARVREFLARKKAKQGWLDATDSAIDEVLEIREYGGSTSVAKFGKMAAQAVEEGRDDEYRLCGSYVFNGAQQTGRFSSRGIQVHNLPRDSLEALEGPAMEAILGMDDQNMDREIEGFAAKFGAPGFALSRLIRPSLIAGEGKVLAWSDWSNIEARVLPWLAGTAKAEVTLDRFRHADQHPEEPGVYEHTAADILGKDPREVTRAERQSHGKVPTLALGFGGGVNALMRMAATYNVDVENPQSVVDRWRAANSWAPDFWRQIWTAATNAIDRPGIEYRAGRLVYFYDENYLGGSLFCGLPCGRFLTYPTIRWKEEESVNAAGEKFTRHALTYRKGRGRVSTWYGKLAENATQALAGSLLRSKLVVLEEEYSDRMPCVLHTHDDIAVEVAEADAEWAKAELAAVMSEPEAWSEGLPLAAEASSHWFFTKAKLKA